VDVGIVWETEIKNALEEKYPVERISLPPKDSLIDEVSYVIGMLTASAHQAAAQKYLNFLQNDDGQEAYAQFGFVKASKAELELRSIP